MLEKGVCHMILLNAREGERGSVGGGNQGFHDCSPGTGCWALKLGANCRV